MDFETKIIVVCDETGLPAGATFTSEEERAMQEALDRHGVTFPHAMKFMRAMTAAFRQARKPR